MSHRSIARALVPQSVAKALRGYRNRPAPQQDAETLKYELEFMLSRYAVGDEQKAIAIPPPILRHLVSGETLRQNEFLFLPSGRRAHERLLEVVASSGLDVNSPCKVLDWGCGCGRVIRHWLPYRETCDVYGCDINADAIGWCREHLKFADFRTCDFLPPTTYSDATFDLVFGGSVLTHMSLASQLAWMGEIWRVLRPGGLAVLTFHGAAILATWAANSTMQGFTIDEELFLTRSKSGEGSNDYFTAQTIGALRNIYSPFDKLAHLPLHCILGGQDTAVFQKPADAGDRRVDVNEPETFQIELGAGSAETTAPVTLDGQSRVLLYVSVNKFPDRAQVPLQVSATLADASGHNIATATTKFLAPRDCVYHTLLLELPEAARGDFRVTLNAESEDMRMGQVAVDFVVKW